MLGEILLLAMLGTGTPPATPPRGAVVDRESRPVHLIGGGKAGARILLDAKTVPGLTEAAMTELIMLPGTTVPEHVHEGSAELLYVLEGKGTMTLGGETLPVRAGMAIYIPAGVKHSLVLDSKVEPLRAIQIYTPGGPEQRFRAGEAVKE